MKLLPLGRLKVAGALWVALFIAGGSAFATQDPGDPPPPFIQDQVASDEFKETGGGAIYHFTPPPALLQQPVTSATRQPQGALSGKIVFCSAGHGFGWNGSEWITDRGEARDPTLGESEMVEDFGNVDQLTMFAHTLFNAGATVVPFRPIGFQTNQVVIDNDDPQVTWAGTWTDSTATVFYGSTGDVPYRFAAKSPTETATATYRPTIPQAGFYPVYCWTRDGSDRVNDQLYRINHTGGASEVRVNHQRVGKGWIFLGTYYFDAGTNASVVISNQSASATGTYVFADAIRFGNGMGEVNYGGGTSGFPKEMESSRQWVRLEAGQDAATDLSPLYSSGVTAPPRMAARMNREADGNATERVYIGIHSNALGGGTAFFTARGSIGLYNNESLFPGTKTPYQQELAQLIGREVTDDLVAIGAPPLPVAWSNRSTVTYARTDFAFGEIRDDNINGEMDATIIEVAFHDNLQDTQLMRDAKARAWVARAMTHSVIRYFNTYGGGPLAFPPQPPTNVRVTASGSTSATVAWNAPAAGPGGDAATGYVIYQSSDGYGFGGPTYVSGGGTTSAAISLSPGAVTYVRVAAANPGGESMPSETLAVRLPVGVMPRVLVVNAFDRLDRFMNVRQTVNLGGSPPVWGTNTFDRVMPRRSNSYDYAVQHAAALMFAGVAFDSCANEAVTAAQVSLGTYDAVVWICGEESTTDEAFSNAEQTALTNYLNAGGRLFLSGAEIGWDLDQNAGGQTFYESALRTNYVNDDAATYNVQATPAGIFAALAPFNFDPAAGAPYDADTPDTISPLTGASPALQYVGGSAGTAATQVDTGTYRIVHLAFPFETITSMNTRNALMDAAIEFLLPGGGSTNVTMWMLY